MALPSNNSRLGNVLLATDRDGRTIYEIRPAMQRSRGLGVRRAVLTEGTTLHDIAFDAYGDALMYWAIAHFNGIFDVTTELVAGTEILIPDDEAIQRYLTRSGVERLG